MHVRSLTQHSPHFDSILFVDADTSAIVHILHHLTEDKVEGHWILQPLPWVENLKRIHVMVNCWPHFKLLRSLII